MQKRKMSKEEVTRLPQEKKHKTGSSVADNTGTVFADPTYDVTFKMLFGNDKHKDVLISLLNSLLNFAGDKKIKDVVINSSDLQKESASGVKGAVDVLCTTVGNQKIAVEMQRQYKDYFLPRTQEYMSKIISGQVMDGQSNQYHEAVMDTYVLAIGKQNIFRGKYKVSDHDELFEKTVVPMITEVAKVVPGNKMYWKFFELPRFTKSHKDATINTGSPLKLQWLDFLSHCSEKKETPGTIDAIIKKGYEIMEMANWDQDTRTLYWKQKADEASEIAEAKAIQAEMFEQGIEKGIKEGKLKGEIKGEISKIKGFLDFGVSQEQIIPKLKFLTHDAVKDKLETNLEYIQGHLEDADSDICDELGLVGDLLDN